MLRGLVAISLMLVSPALTFAAPPPTSGPSCSITFDTNPINVGDGTNIHWISTGEEWMYINSIGYVQGSGSAWVQPSQTTNYDGSIGHTVTSSGGTSGTQTYSTPGTHTFNVPANYETLTVKVWGGGGGGRGAFYGKGNGGPGGTSSFNGVVIAHGGGGANTTPPIWPDEEAIDSGGSGGSASGGDVNTVGADGQVPSPSSTSGARGGSSPNGGNGGAGGSVSGGSQTPGSSGSAPGGGGGGASGGPPGGPGGGGGGYSMKTYSAGQLSGTVTVVVGDGGYPGAAGQNQFEAGSFYEASQGGGGAAGRVEVTWTGMSDDGTSNDVTDATCPATLVVTSNQCPAGETWDGTQCVESACPLGYGGTPPSCYFLACPAGYALVGSRCVMVEGSQCAPFYCVGNDLYRNNAQCVGSRWQHCQFGCAADGCLPPPVGTGNITAHPGLVQSNATTLIEWSTTNMKPGSCSVGEDNQYINDFGDGENNSFTSSPLAQKTSYTLRCTDVGDRPFVDSVVVNIIPRFLEL